MQELAKFHWSYANVDYHPDVLGDWQEGGCFTEIEKKLGYRYEMVNGTFPNSANIGAIMPVTIKIANVGFASLYNARTPYLVLRNVANNTEYSIAINSCLQTWSPAATSFSLSYQILMRDWRHALNTRFAWQTTQPGKPLPDTTTSNIRSM
jgi:hypothetical protein